MKKFVFILSLLVAGQCFVLADENKVNYNTPYYNQAAVSPQKQENYAPKNSDVYKPSKENDYILKYNIDDLESAPWLNGGKRKI